jgi:hypothetical protein
MGQVLPVPLELLESHFQLDQSKAYLASLRAFPNGSASIATIAKSDSFSFSSQDLLHRRRTEKHGPQPLVVNIRGDALDQRHGVGISFARGRRPSHSHMQPAQRRVSLLRNQGRGAIAQNLHCLQEFRFLRLRISLCLCDRGENLMGHGFILRNTMMSGIRQQRSGVAGGLFQIVLR